MSNFRRHKKQTIQLRGYSTPNRSIKIRKKQQVNIHMHVNVDKNQFRELVRLQMSKIQTSVTYYESLIGR